MIAVYLLRFNQSFEQLAESEPFPLAHTGELPTHLRLVLPSPTAKYISRTSYFELTSAITIDGLSVYVEVAPKVGQP